MRVMTHNGETDNNGRTRVAFCLRDWAGILGVTIAVFGVLIGIYVQNSVDHAKFELKIEQLQQRVQELSEAK
jgi:hypothetical protein